MEIRMITTIIESIKLRSLQNIPKKRNSEINLVHCATAAACQALLFFLAVAFTFLYSAGCSSVHKYM
jgi:hypothetical protein